jgi:hypothetical protein
MRRTDLMIRQCLSLSRAANHIRPKKSQASSLPFRQRPR